MALIASTRWPPKSCAACSRWSLARRSEAIASRISGWGSGRAAGAAAGWGVAAGTAAAAGVLGEAGVEVTDKHSPSAKITREERVRIFNFIVCSMTFKIFSRGSRNAPRGYHSTVRRVFWIARKRGLVANVNNGPMALPNGLICGLLEELRIFARTRAICFSFYLLFIGARFRLL
jgi:hypothetical protein